MGSRARVLKSLEFKSPDRIPLWRGKYADIAGVGYSNPSEFQPESPGEDEWGCVWKSFHEKDQGQVVFHPLADWNKFRDYSFPDPYARGRFNGKEEVVEKLKNDGKFVLGSLGKGPLHRLDFLRGFENYLADLLLDPRKAESILDGIFSFLEGLTKEYSRLGVDGLLLYDDQAIQSGPLFSMDIWRKMFKPRFKKLCSMIHGKNMKFFLHSCGHLGNFLPEFVEIGIDLVDNKQPELWMNHPSTGKARGRITFSTCIDIQKRMEFIKLEDIEAETYRLIRKISVPEGGFVATYYEQSSEDKKKIMIDAFTKFSWNDRQV